ncbi:hypothetical protein E4U42_002187 [Claviceps africana]|uniref:Uncharacterized protein n=1 Tax=Claviceps africana TaxID=83212 RepID=A0A8K0J8C0_9HYPO|nr:hypothetical protein E4U42_002187 [Claviceps africana]
MALGQTRVQTYGFMDFLSLKAAAQDCQKEIEDFGDAAGKECNTGRAATGRLADTVSGCEDLGATWSDCGGRLRCAHTPTVHLHHGLGRAMSV